MILTRTYSADIGRLEDDLSALAAIGKGNRGITRLAYSQEESAAHHFVSSIMDSIGMETRTDQFGNSYGLLNSGSKARKVVIGSHLDTIRGGGRYDGALGVVMGLEAARVFAENRSGIALEVVVFRAEESARFKVGCIGSKLATGALDLRAQQMKDFNGVSAYSAIRGCGFNPEIPTRIDKARIRLYVEPHIEQGRVLEENGMALGIVTGISAPLRYEITVLGNEDHSGATPMYLRRDALAAASEMAVAVETASKDFETQGHPVRATVPYMSAKDSAMNKVAGKVVFALDIRGASQESRRLLENRILADIRVIAGRRNVEARTSEFERGIPVTFEPRNYEQLEHAARRLSVPSMHMPSGASHDAQYIALFGVPTAMLFVRNSNGSHNPNESVRIEDVVAGTNVLIESIVRADAR